MSSFAWRGMIFVSIFACDVKAVWGAAISPDSLFIFIVV
jgi:hypothetical protein